jgi:hypothetical protein
MLLQLAIPITSSWQSGPTPRLPVGISILDSGEHGRRFALSKLPEGSKKALSGSVDEGHIESELLFWLLRARQMQRRPRKLLDPFNSPPLLPLSYFMLVFDFDAWPQKVQAFQEHGFSERLIGLDPLKRGLEKVTRFKLGLRESIASKVCHDSTELLFRLLFSNSWLVHSSTSLRNDSHPGTSLELLPLDFFTLLSTFLLLE